MATEIYYDDDADLLIIQGRKVAVLGYGSQGHAHALNLHESGLDVIVGLYEGSSSKAKAEAEGLTVMNTADAAKAADVIMILTPDETQHDIFERDIKPNLKDGDTLMVAHGFNILYGQIVPPKGVDVSMIAPKSPGHLVRDQYKLEPDVAGVLVSSVDANGPAAEKGLQEGDVQGDAGGDAGHGPVAEEVVPEQAAHGPAPHVRPGWTTAPSRATTEALRISSSQSGAKPPSLSTSSPARATRLRA